MGDLLSAGLVLACLIGVFFLLLGGMRRNGYAAKTLRGVGSYRMPENSGRLAGGVLAVAAVAGVLEFTGADISASVAVGALTGLSCTLLPLGVLRPVLEVIGVVGGSAAVLAFVTGDSCVGLAPQTRIMMVMVLAIAALAGAALALLRGGIRSVSALALFAVVEILTFLAFPFGVPMFAEHAALAPVLIGVAGLLGFVGSLAPGVVIGLGAFGVTVATALVSAGYGSACAAGGEPALLLGIGACAAAYLAVRAVFGGMRRR
ncbi:hypothetical protein ACFQ58_13350 [Agromyces sp. NPDC056523]|uniref:hypothetical protein n=1 Tax=Agromyces sp. NPDC056523 TaxID=3345850 RepID=UPI00367012B3